MKTETLSTVTPYMFKFLVFCQLYFSAANETIAVIMVLVVIDFITGNIKAIKLKESITSKLWRRTFGKIIGYIFGILVSTIVESYSGIPLIKILGLFVVSIETKSIFENLYVISGVDLWAALKDKLSALSSKESLMINPEDKPKPE